MWPDRVSNPGPLTVSNPGPLTYESGVLSIALRDPARTNMSKTITHLERHMAGEFIILSDCLVWLLSVYKCKLLACSSFIYGAS